MRTRLILIFCALLLISRSTMRAQASFTTMEYVDINNIKATQLVHGDMWWNPIQNIPACEFPKGSGKSVSYASAIWMAGYDAGNQLHIAAQTYRQNGNDYWPGPLDTSGTILYSTSKAWAKIWKVNQTQIDSFHALTAHTTTNTPAPILQWPAKGNPYATGDSGTALTINTDMAPFVDVDNDGLYNPLRGDFPAIKGDQALWWVFNDNGPSHKETNGLPLKVQVQVMAYAYSRGTIMDNVIYYDYNVINKSSNSYTNFRFGQFADLDLGVGRDDYFGFDSTHRMGIVYNATSIDGTGQPNAYGDTIPMAAVSMVSLPGDGAGSIVPAGSFILYADDYSATGIPTLPGQYNNYLRSTWKDGTHLKNDFTGAGNPSYGYGASYPDCNYEFTGDPGNSSEWSECVSGDSLNDLRFVLASNDFTLDSGESKKITMALITTNPTLNNSCPNANFSAIKITADTAWYFYQHPVPMTGIANVQPANNLRIYPNPTHDKLFIDNLQTGTSIVVYNMLGQVMQIPVSINTSITQLDVAGLPSGVYNILYNKQGVHGTARFVKD